MFKYEPVSSFYRLESIPVDRRGCIGGAMSKSGGITEEADV